VRWNIVRKAWQLARDRFPDVRRLFVDVPSRLAPRGEMAIIDLDKPKEPLSRISFQVQPSSEGPSLLMSLGDEQSTISLPRGASRTYGTPSRREALRASRDQLLAARYGDEAELAEARELMGMDGTFNLRLARSGKRKFKDYERVRILDPRSMQFQELGQVMTSRREKDQRFYLVLVDGSSKPQWFPDDLVGPNLAGVSPDD